MRDKGRTRNEISGGIFFSAVIQGRDITVVLPREVTPAMAGLRDESAVFTGRDEDLRTLMRALDPAAPGLRARCALVSGLAGVGKTELVLHAAHAALRNGWFPGGVLFADMLGYVPERKVEAGAALEGLLRAAGVPGEHIPADTQDRSRLFASVLAAYAGEGRPVLVVVDNVSSAAQVSPLVPPAGKVLVTSRHTLELRNAQKFQLGKLALRAGVDLLAGELELAGGTDTRVADQPDDALSIARLCDGLPLALHIIASLLAAHPARPLSSMAADLEDARTRLDEMRYAGADGDELAVRSAFDLSYRQLIPEQARVFCLLTLNLGPEISTEAASAMASLDGRTAQRHLLELERAHLVESGSRYGRWRMHDLIRVYAAGHLDDCADWRAAFARLLAYYLEATLAATRHLEPAAARPAAGPFADRGQALAWLDAEYPNLTPFGQVLIVEPAFARPVLAGLFLQLWRYFELRRYTEDWIRLTTIALHIARALRDRDREADALTKLGGAFRQARRFGEAIAACQDAAAIQRELGDRHAEGIALNNLAAAQAEAGRYDEAVLSSRDAAAIFRETADQNREGIALGNLGAALMGMKRFTESVSAFEKVVSIFRETGDRHAEGVALTNLGNALREAGQRLDDAITADRQAAAIMRETDDRHGTGMALSNLAATLYAADRFDEAVATAEDGLTVLRELGDLRLEGAALINLGLALQKAGRPDRAVAALRDAVTAFRRGGDRDGEGQARNSLGGVLLDADRAGEAIAAYRAAAAVFRESGDRAGEGETLVFLGKALGLGRIDDAITVLHDAAQNFTEAGDRDGAQRVRRFLQSLEEFKRATNAQRTRLAAGRFEEVIADYQLAASALEQLGDRYGQGVMSTSLGSALAGAGRFDQAITVLEKAAVIFGETGDPDREGIARTELEAARRAQAGARAAAGALDRALRTAGPAGQRAAVDACYQRLGPHDARLFRLLSAIPGPDIATPAAAVLAAADRAAILGRLQELTDAASLRDYPRLFRRLSHLYRGDAQTARSGLETLAGMRLIEPDTADPGRWQLRDPALAFAARCGRGHARQDMRGPVRTLLLIYYLAGTSAASAHLDVTIADPAGWGFRDKEKALEWLDAEYPNLVAAVRAAADGDDIHAVIALDLTRALFHIMTLRRRFGDAVALGPIAKRAARRLHDRPAEAVVLRNFGSALAQVGRSDEAVTALRDAIRIYRDIGDQRGEGTSLTNLGGVLTRLRQFDQAITTLRDALDIHRQTGIRYSEGVALVSLGGVLTLAGQFDEAIAVLRDADRIFREAGDQHARPGTLVNLGAALQCAARYDDAIRAYRKAARIARLAGDQPDEALILTRLAGAYRESGRLDEAGAILREAALIRGTLGG